MSLALGRSVGAAGPITVPVAGPSPVGSVEQRVAALSWSTIHADLDARGFAVVPALLKDAECVGLTALYEQPSRFRSRVVMARHGFGRGEYRYFARPLPDAIAALRAASYPRLVPLADAWSERMRQPRRYPATLDALHAECRAVGQVRPTPLLLKYGPDDDNCFAVHHRPVEGTRGSYRVNMRHGVSRIRRGQRFAAGIIFHDAV
jgi:hypothetical protein